MRRRYCLGISRRSSFLEGTFSWVPFSSVLYYNVLLERQLRTTSVNVTLQYDDSCLNHVRPHSRRTKSSTHQLHLWPRDETFSPEYQPSLPCLRRTSYHFAHMSVLGFGSEVKHVIRKTLPPFLVPESFMSAPTYFLQTFVLIANLTMEQSESIGRPCFFPPSPFSPHLPLH